MAYRYGDDRNQMVLFPESLDSYVPPDHPVRAYETFVDTLDFKELGITEDESQVGNPEYHPRLMLKLLLYGYSYGIRSSRKLEREVYNNVTFMWLIRNLKPDHKTIAEFRRKNKKALHTALKLCARLCIKLQLIEGNTIFIDGTKIRAHAGRASNYSEQWYREHEDSVNARIAALLEECERIDTEEKGQASMVKMRAELAHAQTLKTKILHALDEFKRYDSSETKNGKERTINMADPESALMRSVQGSHASYNVQSTVDDKHGLIVNADVVSAATDINQFAEQTYQATTILNKKPTVSCADAGYADTEELMRVQSDGTTVIVPSQRQALHEEEKPFSKSAFHYDEATDSYQCPEGHILCYESIKEDKKKLQYRITDSKRCTQCRHFGSCTNNKRGRTITRLVNEKAREQFERQYADPQSQEIYKRRKEKVEHPFGHIKRNLGLTQFSMRGREGAKAEFAIGAICFNIARMITIFGGIQGFITAVLKA